MLFRSSILIAFVLLNGTTKILLLLLLIYANLAWCWKHVSQPAKMGQENLELPCSIVSSTRFLFSHDTTRSMLANLNGNIYLSKLPNYPSIVSIYLS